MSTTPKDLSELIKGAGDTASVPDCIIATTAIKRPGDDVAAPAHSSKRKRADGSSDVSLVETDTVESIRATANLMLERKRRVVIDLKNEVEDLKKEGTRLEAERDDWRWQAMRAIAKEDFEKKNREASDKALLKASYGQLKTELKEDYGVRLREKTSNIEERFKSRLEQKDLKLSASSKALCAAKLDHATEIRELKKKHREEIGVLKEKVVVPSNSETAKARDDLKRKGAQLARSDEQCKRLTSSKTLLSSELEVMRGAKRASELATIRVRDSMPQALVTQRQLYADLAEIQVERDQLIRDKSALTDEKQMMTRVLNAASAFRDVTDAMPLKDMGNYGLTLEELRTALMQHQQKDQVSGQEHVNVVADPASAAAGQGPSEKVD